MRLCLNEVHTVYCMKTKLIGQGWQWVTHYLGAKRSVTFIAAQSCIGLTAIHISSCTQHLEKGKHLPIFCEDLVDHLSLHLYFSWYSICDPYFSYVFLVLYNIFQMLLKNWALAVIFWLLVGTIYLIKFLKYYSISLLIKKALDKLKF